VQGKPKGAVEQLVERYDEADAEREQVERKSNDERQLRKSATKMLSKKRNLG